MSTLEELIKKIDRVSNDAHRNLEDIHPGVRGGWMARIADAKDELKKLRQEYKNTLLSNGVAIFLAGDSVKAGEFAKLIHESGEGLVADAEALYRRLAAAVEPTFGETHQWGVGQTHKLHVALQEIMSEVGLVEIPMPNVTKNPILRTREAIVAHIREIMRESCGDALNSLYMAEQALKAALEIRYMGVLAPVAIMNAKDDEVAGLAITFAKGYATVTLTEEDKINKEFLTKSFTEVNKKIRKKK
jgi:hypothetical protein